VLLPKNGHAAKKLSAVKNPPREAKAPRSICEDYELESIEEVTSVPEPNPWLEHPEPCRSCDKRGLRMEMKNCRDCDAIFCPEHIEQHSHAPRLDYDDDLKTSKEIFKPVYNPYDDEDDQ
jgi:hypothetical protein